MATAKSNQNPPTNAGGGVDPTTATYVGLSFAVFLGLLPASARAHISSLRARNRILSLKLFHADDQLRALRSRRRDDSKANARVAEIFAGHRNAWQREHRRLLDRADADRDEIAAFRSRLAEIEAAEAELRTRVAELEREVAERDDMIEFLMAAGAAKNEGGFSGAEADEVPGENGAGACFGSDSHDPNPNLDPEMLDFKRMAGRTQSNCGWQDVQYDSFHSVHHMKNIVARRESPWKVDGDSTVSSKLKLLEQEMVNLEKVGRGDLSKVSTLMRKQAKRYQSLMGKIDDLCKRMQASDPYEPTLTPEFRTHQQTEFLLEAVRLQHRATETRQKLTSLRSETSKSYSGDELAGQSKLTTRRALDTIGNNFREIQRNLEIWLARIIGDVEGILARDGVSRVRDYCISPYPFVR